MISGVLLFDKPRDWTSHDAVEFFRRQFPIRTKVGHSGTLDPLATGLLVLLIGRATKFQAEYQKLPKAYRGRIRLGLRTDTGDILGKPLSTRPLPSMNRLVVQRALESYCGDLELAVPAFSAVKYKGKPLYAYARRGIAVPLKTRTSHVFEWRLLDFEPPEVAFFIRCSSGTYVRSLADAVGEKLECGAVVSELRREKVGQFSVDNAVTLTQARGMSQVDLKRLILPSSFSLS